MAFAPFSSSFYLKEKKKSQFFFKPQTCSYFQQPNLFLMGAYVRKFQLSLPAFLPSLPSFLPPTLCSASRLPVCPSCQDVSFALVLPSFHLPFFFCPSPLGEGHPWAVSPNSTMLLPPSLLTLCWVATFKVLKFSKSLIVCPNLERRSIGNNKPLTEYFTKISQLKDIKWRQYACWQRIKKAFHRTTNNNLLSSQGCGWFRGEQVLLPALGEFKILYRKYSRLVCDRYKGRMCETLIHLTNINPYTEVRAVENWKGNPYDLRPQGT